MYYLGFRIATECYAAFLQQKVSVIVHPGNADAVVSRNSYARKVAGRF